MTTTDQPALSNEAKAQLEVAAAADHAAETAAVEAEPAPPRWEQHRFQPAIWAEVEVMGHRTRAGSISDAQMGGATLLRIQHPTVADHDAHGPLTELYGPAALFSVRPCSRDEAVDLAERYWRRTAPAMAALTSVPDHAYIDDDEPWDDSYTDDDGA